MKTVIREILASKDGRVSLSYFEKKYGFSRKNLERIFSDFPGIRIGEVYLEADISELFREIRRRRLGLFEILRTSGWKFFEEYVRLEAEEAGFRTKLHYRFRHGGKQWEVDVLAFSGKNVIIFECKRLKRLSNIGRAARKLYQLALSFSKALPSLAIPLMGEVSIYPVLVIVQEQEPWTEENVLVAPASVISVLLREISWGNPDLPHLETVISRRGLWE